MDLHTHGYRPDLSRRPLDFRIVSRSNGDSRMLTTAESVARDVFANVQPDPTPATLGWLLFDLGLHVFALSNTAYSASEILAEHLAAAAASKGDVDSLIVDTLKSIYMAPHGWVGNEIFASALMVLRVIAAIPDNNHCSLRA